MISRGFELDAHVLTVLLNKICIYSHRQHGRNEFLRVVPIGLNPTNIKAYT